MHSTDDVYAERGLGKRQGVGERPALVVVDLNYAFTDPHSPLHCGADEAVSATTSLLSAARAGGRPVAFTTLQYDAAGREVARAFLAKVPGLLALKPGTRWPQIDERIAPREGASTSGCVRATVVDALQYGYRVVVAREAVCDRAPAAHAASLTDIDAKYGDVVGLDAAVALLRGRTAV